jgi:outer membrane protein
MKSARRLAATLALAAVLALVAAPGRADDYKIGVINTERILREAAPAKDAARRIEQEFKARDTALAEQQRELRELTERLDKDGATLSEADRAARQREIDTRVRDVERLRRQIAEDLKVRQFDEMAKIKELLDVVLTKIAKEQGYDLILQDGVYVGRSVDMTDLVIKALGAP